MSCVQPLIFKHGSVAGEGETGEKKDMSHFGPTEQEVLRTQKGYLNTV